MEDTKYERLSVEDDLSTGSKLLLLSSYSAKESPTSRRQAAANLVSTVLLIYCAVSTTIIVFLAAAVLGQLHQGSSCHQGVHGGKPFQAALGSDPTYMSLDHKYDNLWDDFGMASLAIKLPDSAHGEPKHAAISMFHQLHCLTSLRTAIQQAREGHDPGMDWQTNNHWPHCMDYLRKTLLCWADDSIERRFVYDNGTIAPFIDGSQDVRQCGDNRRLIQIMRDHGKDVSTRPFP
ncbi:hypothetical protein S7711_11358 [Stachybotrys chartarum IBT 7711]|uniref:Oxidase ustYa n=1 Tax=Stachybotrys chartarum (strain CBS 109288 / IBT 7711) TaxID=1280523 RepID=A0A084B2Y3_STACB|nr:hypothetical protein S7711_11358 [Stachybotrys chartarum IBT 7711]KFA56357.1 hypothetical protein S40293_11293 [Stachybotrys chartarum IBT 40293]KFA77629.1 hypothetical protein S40288_11493 [Stachybotrys chartarum IBT 40288]